MSGPSRRGSKKRPKSNGRRARRAPARRQVNRRGRTDCRSGGRQTMRARRSNKPPRVRQWLPVVTTILAAATLPLGFASPGEQAPAPTPPGGTILFSSLAPRGWDVYLTDVATKETRRITDHAALDF